MAQGETGHGSSSGPGSPDDPVAACGIRVLEALRSIGAGIDRYRQVVAGQLGLGTAELITISQLHHEEPLPARRIGARTGLTPGSVTALLDRLEARGYVTRVRPPHDRRALQVWLTPAGRALGDGMVNRLLPPIAAIVDEIGPDGARTAVAMLDQIAAALNDVALGMAGPGSETPPSSAGP